MTVSKIWDFPSCLIDQFNTLRLRSFSTHKTSSLGLVSLVELLQLALEGDKAVPPVMSVSLSTIFMYNIIYIYQLYQLYIYIYQLYQLYTHIYHN